MSFVIGRGRYARETYPDRAGASSRGIAGSYLVVLSLLPEADPTPTLCALPNDNTTGLNQSAGGATMPATDVLHVFLFPDACTLTRVNLLGDSGKLGTVNALAVAGTPVDMPIDLYIDQVFVATLLTLPASATDIDIIETPGIAIPAGAEVQFVIPEPGQATGDVRNFLFAFSIG